MKPLTSFKFYTPVVVWFFLVCTIFAVFIDVGIAYSVLPEIREDPKISAINHNSLPPLSNNNNNNNNNNTNSSKPVLSTAQAGLISSIFLTGFVIGVPIVTMLAPKIGTNRLMQIGLIGMVISVVATSFSPNFYVLLVCRFFVGFFEAGFTPFAVNIIDMMFDFPDFGENENETNDESSKLITQKDNKKRINKTMYLSAYFACLPIGASIGMAVGGAVAQHVQVSNSDEVILPGWRCAFLFVDAGLTFLVMIYSLGIPFEYELVELEKRANAAIAAEKETKTTTIKQQENPDFSETSAVALRIDQTSSLTAENQSEIQDVEPSISGVFSVSFLTAFSRLVFHNLNFVLITFGYTLFDFLVNAYASFATIMLVQGPYGISSSTRFFFPACERKKFSIN